MPYGIAVLLLAVVITGYCLYRGFPRLLESLLSNRNVPHDEDWEGFQCTENLFEESHHTVASQSVGGQAHNKASEHPSLAGREIGIIMCGADFSVPYDVVKALQQEVEKRDGKAFDLFGDRDLRSLENLRAYLRLRTIHLICIASIMYTPLRASKGMFVMTTYWQWHSVNGITNMQKVVQAADIYGQDNIHTTIQALLASSPKVNTNDILAQEYVEEYIRQLIEKMTKSRKL
ncbi:hypothetical protein HY620_02875 [Candidatus Uhrbacteria bacterium]|nr:hypothetical protein [Candidatus Uhrbacteria bacterium]